MVCKIYSYADLQQVGIKNTESFNSFIHLLIIPRQNLIGWMVRDGIVWKKNVNSVLFRTISIAARHNFYLLCAASKYLPKSKLSINFVWQPT